MTSIVGNHLGAQGLVPRNPYIAGRALADARGFFGREDILKLVETILSQADQNAIVLFGQRRIGKTSVLLRLRHSLPVPPFRPVYFDLMDHARRPLGIVLYELGATMAAELGVEPPREDDFTPGGEGFRERFLPSLLRGIGGHLRPVILFDEFDVLDVAAEENLPETAAARAFFPFLRRLMESEPRLAFIFVVGRKAEDLSINVKATFKAARYQRISVLDDESARELIGLAERDGTLRFAPAAVERVLSLTSRHPYFTQLMCQLLFDHAYAALPTVPPVIEPAHVDAIVPKVLEAGENIFEWVWDGLPPAERVIFSAVAEVTGVNEVITEDELTGVLQRHGIRILIRELELAPKTLIEWEMLRRVDGGYGFFIDLMRRWVALRKPLPKVKDELDRINPIADQQYHLGYTFYRLGNLAEAVTPLKAALQFNPNHLKARLLLGEALREQGLLDASVKELEEAYRYDEDAARYPLVRALLAQGEELERLRREDEAAEVYERVMAVSPREAIAREHWQALLVARGDRALAAGRFDAALAAYSEAGADDRAIEVASAQRAREIEEFHAEIASLREREEWDQAAERYRRLIELDPKNPRWPEELKRVEREAGVARRYAEALGADQQGKVMEAQRAFADVIAVRPDYEEAAERLAAVVRAIKAARRDDASTSPDASAAEPPWPAGTLWTTVPEPEARRHTRRVVALSLAALPLLLIILSRLGGVYVTSLPEAALFGLLLAIVALGRTAAGSYRRLIGCGVGLGLAHAVLSWLIYEPYYYQERFAGHASVLVLAYACYFAAVAEGRAVRPAPMTVFFTIPAGFMILRRADVPYDFVPALVLGAVAWAAVDRWRLSRTTAAALAAMGGLGLLLSDFGLWISLVNEHPYPGYIALLEATLYTGHWLMAISVYAETTREQPGAAA